VTGAKTTTRKTAQWKNRNINQKKKTKGKEKWKWLKNPGTLWIESRGGGR
jgi:hypothetical protein